MQTPNKPSAHVAAWNALLVSAIVVASFGSLAAIAATPAAAVAATPDYAFVQVDGMRCVVDRRAATLVLRDDGQPECAAPMSI